MADSIEIIEVSPRDGIQNQPALLSTDDKVSLIKRAASCGVKRIEVTSFVNPKRVPQMADADAVAAALPQLTDVRYAGLADTIGVATPKDIHQRVGAVRNAFPEVPVRLHLPNTRNMGIANAWAGIEAGVASLDSSMGGVGGCPFAPNATGNIATEDLLYLLDRSGIDSGVSLQAAIDTATWLEEKLGKPSPGMLMKAGGFPADTVIAT